MRSLRIRAYAKINLGLKILGKRPDRYHEIDTILQSIDLADELVLEPRSDGQITLVMEPDLHISAEQNLAMRAACLVRESVGLEQGVHIHLSKKIPMGAGLGGGSSDGAAVLVGLNQLFELGFSRSKLKALGAELGSDVPFFMEGGRCRAQGRGEILSKLSDFPDFSTIVLLVAPFSLATKDVYAALDRLGSAAALTSPYPNDLEAAALKLQQQLWAYREFLMEQIVPFGLSGSGPTYYAVCEDERAAHAFSRGAESALHCKTVLCKPIFTGHTVLG